jgi:hypothetical protein
MPQNFNQTLNDAEPQSTVVPKDFESHGAEIASAGKSIASLVDSLTAGRTEQAAGSFASQITDVESGVVRYWDRYAEIQEQMAKADATTRGQFEEQMKRLRAGQEQGALSPTQARLRSNTLLKQYSSNYPMLAKDLRAMANESQNNFREIANEVLGLDPINKAASAVMEQATATGSSPDAVVHAKRSEEAAKATLTAFELKKKTGDVNREETVMTLQSSLANQVVSDIAALFNEFGTKLRSGQPVSEKDMLAAVARIEAGYRSSYMANASATGLEKGFSMRTEDYEAIMAPATKAFEMVRQTLTNSGTFENKMEIARLMFEQDRRVFEKNNMQTVLSLPMPFSFFNKDTLAGGAMAAWSIINNPQKYDSPEGQKMLEDWANQGITEGNPEAALGLLMSKDRNVMRQLGLLSYNEYLTGQPGPGSSNIVTRTQGALMFDDHLALLPPAERPAAVNTAMPRLSWAQIKKLPNVQQTIASNPDLSKRAIEMAAGELLAFANKVDVEFTSDPLNPIRDKSKKKDQTNMERRGDAISGPNTENAVAVRKLNDEYRFIAGTFGAAGAEYLQEYMGWNIVAKPKADSAKP